MLENDVIDASEKPPSGSSSLGGGLETKETMTDNGADLTFIVGHYKSGSTWLLNMLSLHPDIRGLQETHIFHHSTHSPDFASCTKTLYSSVPWSGGGMRQLASRRLLDWSRPLLSQWKPGAAMPPQDRPATLLDLSLRDQTRLRRTLHRSVSPDDYCHRFFAFLVDRLRPNRYLLEKTPNNMPYLDEIRRIFPAAKLIAVYRDGRDVVVSDRFFREGYQGSRGWSFDASVRAWRSDMESQLEKTSTGEIVTLSYESLLSNGKEVLDRLLRELDLATGDEILADILARSSFRFRTGRERGQEDRKSFNRKGIAGDWRNHFCDEDKRRFKELAGDLLITLGYERDYDW